MSLPQEFLIKAQNELHETEIVREQSLHEFRQWIAQHDYFVDCRKGKQTDFRLASKVLNDEQTSPFDPILIPQVIEPSLSFR